MDTYRLRRKILSFISQPGIRKKLPEALRGWGRRVLPATELQQEIGRHIAVERWGSQLHSTFDYSPKWDVLLLVADDRMWFHMYYLAACRDLGVPFKVFDPFVTNWHSIVRSSGAGAVLAWPALNRTCWRHIYDDRLRLLAEAEGVLLCPSATEMWLHDSKQRVGLWLTVHGVPHPETWMCYSGEEAMEAVHNAEYPLVFKTDLGAAASGVRIVRTRREAERIVRQAFSRGVGGNRNRDNGDREFGFVIFQEFIPHSHEWRVVRVGNWYQCRKKTRVGDYASGAGTVQWAWPPDGLLEFVAAVTDMGGFENMALDIFEAPAGDPRGPFLVNEMHCVVGRIAREHNRNEATGRWVRESDGRWVFEPGFFYSNACANLRVEWVLSKLGARRI